MAENAAQSVDPVDPARFEALAVEIAREAGMLARRRREEGVAIAGRKSSVADIVTEADREVEALIRARLAAARPDDAFLGEESGVGTGDSGVTWVVDPIDGTVNYAYGIPQYAVSIAVVTGPADPAGWRAQAAAVFNPVTDEMFHARRDGGTRLNGTAVRVGEPAEGGALLATGFGYDKATHAPALAMLGRVMAIARDIRRAGAASLDLAYVAAGRLDGYYERGLQPWDYAAGALLVTEAGGRVGGVGGAAAGREMTIAAAPELFARIEGIVAA